ncbi:MAG: endonuclease MutS2, partial [Mesobacillus sp.]
TMGELGIIYKGPDENGNYIVQIKGEKIQVNYKRLKLNIPAAELYPPDYDFNIIFESKHNRKLLNQMDKKHLDGTVINYDS